MKLDFYRKSVLNAAFEGKYTYRETEWKNVKVNNIVCKMEVVNFY